PQPTAHRLVVPSTAASTPALYTLSLHDALPISRGGGRAGDGRERSERRRRHRGDGGHHPGDFRADGAILRPDGAGGDRGGGLRQDRKSTRLNSSHSQISYAVFCLKKKKKNKKKKASVRTCMHISLDYRNYNNLISRTTCFSMSILSFAFIDTSSLLLPLP